MTFEPDVQSGSEQGRPTKAKVFLSYSRQDMAFADRLEAALEARGFDTLIDRSEIYAFEEWWKRIEALIGRADTIVFIISPDAVASEICQREIAFAASLNKRLAPIVCRRVDDKAVPETLAKLNFVFFDDAAAFEASADRLAEALATDIGWIRQHTDFGEQARRWAAEHSPSGLLLRSPVLEQAERWIAARPAGAPAPTEETQRFIRRSRQGATRRRNMLTGSLAAGLVLALGLAALAYWQRGLAVEQRGIAVAQRTLAERNEAQAKEERDRATRNFELAHKTAQSLVFDTAQGLSDVQGMSAETVRKILETAKGTFEQLTTSAPDNLELQRSRAAMLSTFGVTYMRLGNLDLAATAFREQFAISEHLAVANPGNALWQHALRLSYNNLGDVFLHQGRLDEAIKAYRDALAIAERLVAADRTDTRQGNLAEAHWKIGGVQKVQGDLEGARKSYHEGVAIIDSLARSNPGNARWLHSLSVAYELIGNIQLEQGDLAGALRSYRDDLAIIDQLAKLDPTNTRWQRALSVAHNKVGDMHERGDDLADALKSYRDSLAIIERLSKFDPGNAGWQRDLAVTYERMGDVQIQQGDLVDASSSYRNRLAIAERLSESNRVDTGLRLDLSVAYEKIGNVLEEQKDIAGAVKSYRDSLAIREQLVQSDPSNAAWQRSVMTSYVLIAQVDAAHARAMLTRALEIAKMMQAKGLLAPRDAWMPDDLVKRIADLPQ